MKKNEKWSKISGIDNNYKVSDFGNVINLDTNRKIGSIGTHNYVVIWVKINGVKKLRRVHQFVWGEFGKGTPISGMTIDHINNISSDNRIENLQLIPFRSNVHKEIKSRSGIIGIHWSNNKKRWRTQISLNNVRYHLGYRKTIEEAKKLYDEALKRFEETGLSPNDIKEKLPEGLKRCTKCKEILNVSEFDNYTTCRGHLSLRSKCRKCYKEYRSFHDKKYRNKNIRYADTE